MEVDRGDRLGMGLDGLDHSVAAPVVPHLQLAVVGARHDQVRARVHRQTAHEGAVSREGGDHRLLGDGPQLDQLVVGGREQVLIAYEGHIIQTCGVLLAQLGAVLVVASDVKLERVS